MRKLVLMLGAFVCLMQTASAQKASLRGKVMDTLENRVLTNAVVSLLHKSDSTLARFTRTTRDGRFSLSGIDTGKYIMLVSYPRFADLVDEIVLPDGEKDLGQLSLTQKAVLMREVVVRSAQAIRIKGDTTEFTADSFAVKEGATVEDLLKKLPGFQVNSKGEITAQGKRVEKVLVDGEEFFGDDPTMATQNLAARAVDKVQIFDTKTEQQQLSGITTGTEGKTVNIKLKEDQKKGSFGKAVAGSDFRDYFDSKLLYNRFKGKKKISGYGTKSNINTGSLSWQDREKLGIEDDYEYDEIGGYYYSFGSSDDFSDWSLKGLPQSYTAGALFINKWNEDRQSLNTSYRYNYLATDNDASTLTQNLVPYINYRNRYTNSKGINRQHALNGKYEWKIDSLASIKYTVAGIHKTTGLDAEINSEFLNSLQKKINDSRQDRWQENERLQTDHSLQYKQLFNKKNRQLLANVRLGITEDDQVNMNYTRISYYDPLSTLVDSVDEVDQMKNFAGKSTTIGTKLTFNEPLNAKFNVILDYAYNTNVSSSYRNTFNKSTSGKYDERDEVFSNNFDLDVSSHSTMALLRYLDPKLKFAFGSGASKVVLRLHDLDTRAKRNFEFLNLTPQGQASYTFKPQTTLSANYRGTTRQPSINQLQPLRDNNDPLYEYRGNPDLKVGFNHSMGLNFMQYKVLKNRYFYIGINYNAVQRAVAQSISIDTVTGRQTYMPVNVNGNSNWNLWTQWHKGGGEKQMNYSAGVDANGGRNHNLINGLLTRTDFQRITLRVSTGYENPDKHSFNVRPYIGYNISSSSSPKTKDRLAYYTYGGYLSGFIMLPWKLELNSDADFQLRERIEAFKGNTDVIYWNASLARKIFKKKTGKIMFRVNDILDQNKGFERIINNSFVQEERFARISRYFMLQFEWTFNQMPGSK